MQYSIIMNQIPNFLRKYMNAENVLDSTSNVDFCVDYKTNSNFYLNRIITAFLASHFWTNVTKACH